MSKAAMKVRVAAVLFGAGAWMAGTGTAHATLDMQKKAKKAGFPAANCQYCHEEKLPKKDTHKLNARGTWLAEQKAKHPDAKEIDLAWLKDYVEPKK